MQPILVRTIIAFTEKRSMSADHRAHRHYHYDQELVEGIFMAIGLFVLSVFMNFGRQHVCIHFRYSSFLRYSSSNTLLLYSPPGLRRWLGTELALL